MRKDSETTQSTHAQDSQTLNYLGQDVLKKSLTTSYLQQQMQSPVKAPSQGSGGQSGTGSSQSTPATSDKK